MCAVCDSVLCASECDCPEENCDMQTGECLPEASKISECNIGKFKKTHLKMSNKSPLVVQWAFRRHVVPVQVRGTFPDPVPFYLIPKISCLTLHSLLIQAIKTKKS